MNSLAKTRSIVVLTIAGILLTTVARVNADETPWMHPPEQRFDYGWGILSLEGLYDSASLEGQESLTGSWGGLRERLYRAGIAILGSYESEVAGNPSGGDVHKVRYTQNVGVGVFLDLEQLFHLKGAYFLVSAAESPGSSLSGDIPNFFDVQQLYVGQTIRLVNLAVEQNLLDDKLSIVGGRLNALDDFAESSFYCYSQNGGICGNPSSLESNSSLSDYPFASWGLRARYDITSEFYSMTGAYNTYVNFEDNKYHGVDFSIRRNSGVAVMQEFGYRPSWESQEGYPGFFKLGGFYDSEPRLRFESDTMRSGTWMIYGSAQQHLYRRSSDGLHQGLTGFLSLTYAPPAMNTIQYLADAGLVYVGLIPGRPEDVAGVLGVFGDFSSDLRSAQRAAGEHTQTHEAVIEGNYKYLLFPWIYVQPDMQFVFRPEGTGKISDALVFALQVGVEI